MVHDAGALLAHVAEPVTVGHLIQSRTEGVAGSTATIAEHESLVISVLLTHHTGFYHVERVVVDEDGRVHVGNLLLVFDGI